MASLPSAGRTSEENATTPSQFAAHEVEASAMQPRRIARGGEGGNVRRGSRSGTKGERTVPPSGVAGRHSGSRGKPL